ncbi:response regulator transcription factor [Nocardioides acrostichi]|uniref:response regulator transcription factor n=1 Tax=Nocardioides acrostichi TaxID=2784339 RepID=UPI002E2DD758|nr:response regulator transcription factor [Nocardioides acrostichi]
MSVLNDYDIIVQGLCGLLAPHSERVEVVELVVGDVEKADDGSRVDLVLYDTFGQQQCNVLDVQRLSQTTGAKVVVFSWNVDPTLVREAMRRGAAGYLEKSLSGAALANALVRIHQGERLQPSVDRVVESNGDWPGRAQGLSAREGEMMALIAQGLSNQEMAERAYLSVNSVKTYVRTAYRKLGLSRRSQAVRWGIEHGFLPDATRREDVAPGA